MAFSRPLWMFCNCIILATLAAADVSVVSGNFSQSFNDIRADFGPSVSEAGLSGRGVIAHPLDGCSPIRRPPNDLTFYFAIIKRGSCHFDLKVYHAQNANYKAVIVYNDLSDRLEKMDGKNYTNRINIPSVFIGNASGVQLLKTIKRDSGALINIYPEYNFPWDFYFIPFAIVICISFLIMSLILVCKCREMCIARRETRLARANLNRLKVVKFKKGDEYDVCAICLDEYNEGEKLRILPCKHAYHCKCIDPWLTDNKRECPVCKRRVNLSARDDCENPSENTPLLANA
ncbi:E3 ubiquitin-protein ligase RNF13 [Trichoplax sp. H2]|uniref:RING-type domain-containing protein n=1 Tax=Trichoplax adhaerens TaxID=10228 RepID=B3RIX0_TRIAD|nr:hypothetical protein TRIADDRAFT_63462 [Trichoplax adhaerens]EDV28464.1 hypothetical protein TRIADDRAFT_63462 [Trichoplax adhaerens]RDD38470.1 E3 ubiquitin-protein ligase RNF13 [Trichoplax sp. H2]|eukprot:XP_002107666.1 hypothetical protein TRIADDRAFT_63462 [Trichoplax adhaerens]